MSHAYLVEIENETAGIAIKESSGYRFYATRHSFSHLQKLQFNTASEVKEAVLSLFCKTSYQRSSLTPLHLD
jgi:hypothetical protein